MCTTTISERKSKTTVVGFATLTRLVYTDQANAVSEGGIRSLRDEISYRKVPFQTYLYAPRYILFYQCR